MTIAELQTQPLAALTDADISYVKSNTVTTTGGAKYLPAPTTGPVTLNWTVPTGALGPTSIQVYGNAGAFNDKVTVASTARTGDIVCSAASASDTHCSAGNYAANSRLVGAHLWASDAVGREFAHFYAFYAVTIQ